MAKKKRTYAENRMTDAQKNFCKKFVELGGTSEAKHQAMMEAYPNIETKERRQRYASELLHKPTIQAEIRRILDDARFGYVLALPKIQNRAINLALDQDDDGKKRRKNNHVPMKVQADLLKDLQDRAGMKPAEKHEVLTGTVFAVMSEEDAREVIRKNIQAASERLSNMQGKKIVQDEKGRTKMVEIEQKKQSDENLSTIEVARRAIR